MNTHSIDSWVKVAQIAQGFSTPVIALLVAFITFLIQRRQTKTQERQAETQRLQHRLALMDRRLKVFNAAQEFIALVLQEARLTSLEPLFKLTRETREHHFLFGAEIGEYIDELYSKGNKLRQFHAATRGTDVLRPEDIEPETEINMWFSGQIGVAEQKFLKYIDFREP